MQSIIARGAGVALVAALSFGTTGCIWYHHHHHHHYSAEARGTEQVGERATPPPAERSRSAE